MIIWWYVEEYINRIWLAVQWVEEEEEGGFIKDSSQVWIKLLHKYHYYGNNNNLIQYDV